MMASRTRTPAQRQRNKFVKAVRTRGADGYSLWFVHPPLDPHDDPLILCSDLELNALFYLEGSPDLVEIDYSCLRCGDLPLPRAGERVFAIAKTVDGQEIEAVLAPEATTSGRPGSRIINLPALARGKTRIQSWRAIVAAVNRCRLYTLDPVLIRCRRIIETSPGTTIEQVCRQVSEHRALVIGSLGMMLRTRELESDLDERLWSPNTVLIPTP
jgi:hypothetical protein